MINNLGIKKEMMDKILEEEAKIKEASSEKGSIPNNRNKKKKRRKEIFSSIKSIVNQLLTENNNERYYNVCESLVASAETGNLKAIELIRDLEKEDNTTKDLSEEININVNLSGGNDGIRSEE